MYKKQATHKSGNGTVVVKETDGGYVVTVHKQALPPHYRKVFATKAAAKAHFKRLSR